MFGRIRLRRETADILQKKMQEHRVEMEEIKKRGEKQLAEDLEFRQQLFSTLEELLSAIADLTARLDRIRPE